MRRRMGWGLGLLLGLLLGGCALSPIKPATTICIEVDAAQRALTTVHGLYARAVPLVVAKCTSGAFTPAECATLAEADAALKRMGFEADRVVLHPGVSVDWALVLSALAVLVGAVL